MIDRLEIKTTEELNLWELYKKFPEYDICKSSDSYYKQCFNMKSKHEKILRLMTTPFWDNGKYKTKIVLNPSKWNSLSELVELLSRICTLENLEIVRIDHAVDLRRSVDEVFSGVRIKHKQKSGIFKENYNYKGGFLTGFNLGNKPELYCIYDKGYEANKNKLVEKSLDERGKRTRIELRQFNNKIRFKRFLDLEKYIEAPPFNEIEVYEVNDALLGRAKAQELLNSMKSLGLQSARAKLNKRNNFDRDYGKYLKLYISSTFLNQKYKEELRQFCDTKDECNFFKSKTPCERLEK